MTFLAVRKIRMTIRIKIRKKIKSKIEIKSRMLESYS